MQDRDAILLKGITKSDRGIEVAPWFSPRASKRAGYDCLSLDVFDTRHRSGTSAKAHQSFQHRRALSCRRCRPDMA